MPETIWRKLTAACSAALLAVAASAAPTYANIFDVDDRVELPNAKLPGEPYVPIGRYRPSESIADGKGGHMSDTQGTAFLISPCYLVSNYHVVYGYDVDGPDEGKQYRGSFILGTGEAELTSNAVPVMHGNYQARAGAGDWVLLKLSTCLGERADVGWFEVSTMGSAGTTRQPLMSAGFFGDRSWDAIFIDPSCRVHTGNIVGLAHDCASRPGASGAPMLAINRSGVPVVLGVNGGPNKQVAGVQTYTEDTANYATQMAEILNTPGVLNLLRPDLERMTGGNPSQLRFPKPPPLPVQGEAQQ